MGCLFCCKQHGIDELERYCARHPAHAAAIREQFRYLRGLGLLPARDETIPETLGRFRILSKLGGGGHRNAAGFSVRENKIYVYRFKTCLMAAGGAVNVFRPRSVGEGTGRA